MNLQTIARALGGIVSNGHVLAPGPGHSKHDRSLAVFLDPNLPDLFRVHSFAGDDWRTCRDYVKDRLGIRDQQPVDRSAWEPRQHEQKITASAANEARTSRALAIWGEATHLDGTQGLTYYANRGVDIGQLPKRIHTALRWHGLCPWEQGRHGCIIALMTDAITGAPKAIHRTAVSPQGQKIGRKMLGRSAGCVIRLWPDDEVTTGLVIGEGIETVLCAATRVTVCSTALCPAWATATAGNLAKFPVLAGIEALTILVDNDESGTGERAALECSERWTAAGREVVRLTPNVVGQDFGDIAGAA